MDNTKNNISEEERQRKLATLFLTLFLICLFGSIGAFMMYQKIQTLEKDNKDIEMQLSSAKKEIASLERELKESQQLYDDKRLAYISALMECNFFEKYAGIVTTTGDKYHTYSCFQWDKNSPFYIYNIENAIGLGYEPCLDCH